MHELSKHHEFLASYVELINKHQRLIEVDIDELIEVTKEPLTTLEQMPVDSPGYIYGIMFGALLRSIELNNTMSREEELTGYKVSQRISFTFRLLRLLEKTYAKMKGTK